MARHRNVRTMNYEDECYDEDDYLGHSVEDNYCISPGTAAQFTFNREKDFDLSTYMSNEKIPEEEEGFDSDTDPQSLNDSQGYKKPTLSDTDQGKLNSCLEEIRNIIGDNTPDHVLCQTIIRNKYDLQASLNELLTTDATPKPQRQPRQSRRNRPQAFAPNPPTVELKTPVKKQVSPVKPDEDTATAVSQIRINNNKQPLRGFEPRVPEAGATPSKDNGERDLRTNSSGNRDVSDGSVPQKAEESVGNNSASTPVQTPKKEASTTQVTKSSSKTKQDKTRLKEEYDRRQGDRDLLNMVVIGHVDAGKSTLMGHLLFQLGMVNKKAMHKYEQESKKVGKGSFAFAWVLDETEEERSRGVTMDIAQTKFETPKKAVTLLDAPGHKDFIPNMITGTAQADVGILVVNATRGEFETGFETGGQTREHALLARSLGVSQLIVAVNKMDTVKWSQDRYDEVTKKLGSFLKTAGYRDTDISFIPCSGLSGENLAKTVSEPQLSAWYRGNTLVEQIDRFKIVTRPLDKPLRLTIGDVFKGMGAGFCVTGRVGAGSVQTGDKVQVMPSGETATVKGIMMGELSAMCAFAGDHVTLTLTGIDITNVSLGSVVCDPSYPIHCATRIRARVVLFNLEIPVTKGFMVVFHYQSITEPAVIKRLVCQLNKSSGEVLKNRPKCLTKNTSAVIEMEFERPVCLELYKEFKDLGRFMLRYSGSTIAAGLVEEILKSKSKTEDTQGAAAY
ncbi:HBS1-like protein isoform X1 [Mizuhopecten yessoensis]|uniref:HBS1-like protein isoform X1 n=2 Tax=Mizuhopecten yessoensis TaxID=6573 RepID=UPI000B459F9A|nr:HBS1-like protein isoform X1 [Mizuhopecten yessoensis]